jgi:hypothetical protein
MASANTVENDQAIRTNVTIHKIRVLKSSVATKKNLINQPMQLTHPFSWKSVCVCASVCVDRDPFYDYKKTHPGERVNVYINISRFV